MNLLRQNCSLLLAVMGLALLTGCATVNVPVAKQKSEAAALAEKLRGLSRQVDPREATAAATAAVCYPLQLAQEYHVTPPAIFNNCLINLGIHPRGLCFEWADDLTIKLMTLHLRTLELHRGVARLDTLREHSCLVVTAKGQSFTNGIALDAWRYCGRLSWAPVVTDKYPWREVFLTADYQKELQAGAKKLEQVSK